MTLNLSSPSVLLFADGLVGCTISQWLMQNFASDIAAVVLTSSNSISHMAKELSIPYHIYDSDIALKLFISENNISVDLGLLCWWPKIISQEIISLSRNGFINTHPSLLPFNRGKNYNFWTLVDETPFGVSIHQVDSGIDTGPVLFQKTIPYDWTDTGETLFHRAQSEMISLFIEHYQNIRTLSFNSIPQDNKKSTMHYQSDMVSASKLELDQKFTMRKLINLLRARTFSGHPACSFKEDGVEYEVRIKITKK